MQALWVKYAPDTPPHYVQASQSLHVSVLSLGSCTGRIFAGLPPMDADGSYNRISDLNLRSYRYFIRCTRPKLPSTEGMVGCEFRFFFLHCPDMRSSSGESTLAIPSLWN